MESIRTNGILQNLTVIPDDDEWTSFTVLIGHRRLAAAKQIRYITEMPCSILVKGIDRAEQIAIMLEENMQRNDLTFLEQAQSFQMMLDLGKDVETIAETTGFSETTVRHRLEIAKLDPELVAERQNDENYQFTLGDYAKLERIEDIEEREKILAAATSGKDIEWRVNSYIGDAIRKRNENTVMTALKNAGIKKSKESIYSSDVERLAEYDLNDLPENFKIPDNAAGDVEWIRGYGTSIYAVKVNKRMKQKSEWELKQKERERRRREIREIQKEWNRQRKEFVKDLIAGRYTKPKKEELRQIISDLWTIMMKLGEEVWIYTNAENIATYLSPKDRYSDKEGWNAYLTQAKHFSQEMQMITLIEAGLELRTGTGKGEIADYEGRRNENLCAYLIEYYSILERFGYQTDEETLQILRGETEIFGKEGK